MSGDAKCPHLDLGPDAVSVIAPRRGNVRIECPCCHLPGQLEQGAPIEPIRCPYCDVAAIVSPGHDMPAASPSTTEGNQNR